MNDPLKQLLKETDDRLAVRFTHLSTDLSVKVLETSRQIKRRRLVATLGLALVGSLAAAVIFRDGVSHQPNNQSRLTETQANASPLEKDETAQIKSQIAEHETIVGRLITAERQRVLDAELAHLNSLPTADDLTERAAAVMVYQIDRIRKSITDPAISIEAYTQVIESFPNTASADIARKRLDQIKDKG